MVVVLDAANEQWSDYLRRRDFSRRLYNVKNLFTDKIRQVFASARKINNK
jgi:hypothetical protein